MPSARAWPRAKIQFDRAIRLGGLFGAHRGFGSVGSTTKGEALRCAVACDVIPFLFVAPFFTEALWISLAFFVIFVLSGLRFYVFLGQEKGPGFALAGVFYDFVLYAATGLGIGLGLAGFLVRKVFKREESLADE